MYRSTCIVLKQPPRTHLGDNKCTEVLVFS